MADRLHKYPRTHHLEGSRFQPGDEDLTSEPFATLAGRHLVVEEKLDGANAGLCFGADGRVRLQSRGHFLAGGGQERQFDLFKRWASTHAAALHAALGDRYVMYGEWLFARHTMFYDALPHYFLEFDLLDTETGEFLSTPRRRTLLEGRPVVSVPVLHQGVVERPEHLPRLVGRSSFIRDGHLARLEQAARSLGLDGERARRDTDPSMDMEGLYVKIEEGGVVTERYKWIRAGFLQSAEAAHGHWQSRPIVPNQLVSEAALW